MKLDSLDFSDLIIMSNGDVFLKGTPEFGAQMRKIPDEYREEVGQLGEVVEKAFASKKHNEMENIRLSFGKLSFRVANYSGVDGSAYFLRRLATRVPTFEELGFYPGLASWLLAPERQKGLVLFCGSQGSGKTTSAASFIAARLQRYGGHAISWENPVEMPLAGAHGDYGYAFQTQVRDESELAAHIERSYRFSNPNIIYVGEIRSQHAASEVSRAALGSANQIVVSTIHGMDIKNALERLLTLACEHDGNIAYENVASSLLAVIYQELSLDSDKVVLNLPEYLLMPFSIYSRPIRSKIRSGKLGALHDDINNQVQQITNEGFSVIK